MTKSRFQHSISLSEEEEKRVEELKGVIGLKEIFLLGLSSAEKKGVENEK